MPEELTLEYIPQRETENKEWVAVNQFIFRPPSEELAVAYAAQVMRLKALEEAEANLVGYLHQESMKIGGRVNTIEIQGATHIMKLPFLTTMDQPTGTPAAMAQLIKELPNKVEWRTEKEVGLQIIASVGWLGAITKARAPNITEDTSSIDYHLELLPHNIEVKDENAPTGYNKRQVTQLQEALNIVIEACSGSNTLHQQLSNMTILKFGELVFKTQSRLFNALPDPDAEEKAKFDAMRDAAIAAKEDED